MRDLNFIIGICNITVTVAHLTCPIPLFGHTKSLAQFLTNYALWKFFLPWLLFFAGCRIWVICWWEMHCKTSASIASSKCIYCWSNPAATVQQLFDETQGILFQQSESIDWVECSVKVLNSALQSLLCTGSFPNTCLETPLIFTYSPQFDNVQKRKSSYTMTTST